MIAARTQCGGVYMASNMRDEAISRDESISYQFIYMKEEIFLYHIESYVLTMS